MIVGQATLGLEISEEVTNIDAVIFPTLINDCGLTTGIVMALTEINRRMLIIVSAFFYNYQLEIIHISIK